MSSWSKVITNKGRQLQAKAQAGAELFYTRMAVGSGTLSGQSLEAMTALITPVTNLEITRLRRPPGTTRAVIGATLTNQTVTTGFFLREAGIYAMDPDDGEILYMYANCGATADYISPDGTDPIEKFLNYNVFVGSAANITANIDESLVYATKQELDEAIAGINIRDASLTEKGVTQLSNATNSTSETMAATPKAVKTVAEAAMAAQTTANAANLAAGAAQTKADQAFQLGNERKQQAVDALIAWGVAASMADSWDTLFDKMSTVIKATGNATAADLLAGKTASNVNGPITGTMPNRGAGGTVTPGTTNQTKAAGYYSSPITVPGDADLVPSNIRSGIDLFGVLGSLEPKKYHEVKLPRIGPRSSVGFTLPFVPKILLAYATLSIDYQNPNQTFEWILAAESNYVGGANPIDPVKTFVAKASNGGGLGLFLLKSGTPGDTFEYSDSLTNSLYLYCQSTIYNAENATVKAWA